VKRAIIETDVLVAAMDPEDPHHDEAKNIIRRATNCSLSPYTLIEVDLLIKSGNIEVRDAQAFWHKLRSVVEYYRLSIPAPKPDYHAEAERLRAHHGLSYFDSLHAAVAMVEEMTLISYDWRAYSRIRRLDYAHPSGLPERLHCTKNP
jgi:predicted nucleic acid-binding protein